MTTRRSEVTSCVFDVAATPADLVGDAGWRPDYLRNIYHRIRRRNLKSRGPCALLAQRRQCPMRNLERPLSTDDCQRNMTDVSFHESQASFFRLAAVSSRASHASFRGRRRSDAFEKTGPPTEGLTWAERTHRFARYSTLQLSGILTPLYILSQLPSDRSRGLQGDSEPSNSEERETVSSGAYAPKRTLLTSLALTPTRLFLLMVTC